PQPEDVEQQSFVVPLPAVSDEPGLGSPAMGQRRPTIPGPIPVGTTVQRVGQASDLDLVGRVTVEIGADGQGAREQKRRVDGGKLALPNAATRFDVQEMVEKSFVEGE